MSIKKYLNREELLKLIRFGLTGGMNTLIDYGVFTLLTLVCSVNMNAATVISYLCGMTNSFIVNRSWTFRSAKEGTGRKLVRFILVNLISLGISVLLLNLFVGVCGFHELLGKLFSLGITTLINFVLSRFWVFKE